MIRIRYVSVVSLFVCLLLLYFFFYVPVSCCSRSSVRIEMLQSQPTAAIQQALRIKSHNLFLIA